MTIEIKQTNEFRRVVKRLSKQQKVELDGAIKIIISDPEIGELKVGDLAGIRVYKFKMNKQLTLLAYEYFNDELMLYLLKLGSHENFYRDLK